MHECSRRNYDYDDGIMKVMVMVMYYDRWEESGGSAGAAGKKTKKG